MKKLVCAALLLSACAPVPPPANPPDQGRIVTEDAFRAAIVGKPIRLREGVVFTVNADNTITGDVNGQTATGTWTFEDGFWCRRITLGDIFTEDCQLWVVEGDRLVITREKGTGESFSYRLRG
jgi:hypothetical protein